jgi:hypothetical protein
MEFLRAAYNEISTAGQSPSLRRPFRQSSGLSRIGPAGALGAAPTLVRGGTSDDLGAAGSGIPGRPELMPLGAAPSPQLDGEIGLRSRNAH